MINMSPVELQRKILEHMQYSDSRRDMFQFIQWKQEIGKDLEEEAARVNKTAEQILLDRCCSLPDQILKEIYQSAKKSDIKFLKQSEHPETVGINGIADLWGRVLTKRYREFAAVDRFQGQIAIMEFDESPEQVEFARSILICDSFEKDNYITAEYIINKNPDLSHLDVYSFECAKQIDIDKGRKYGRAEATKRAEKWGEIYTEWKSKKESYTN